MYNYHSFTKLLTSNWNKLRHEIQNACRELKKWNARSWMPFNLLLPFDSAFTKRDPFGVVLIVGAWNYPILLSLHFHSTSSWSNCWYFLHITHQLGLKHFCMISVSVLVLSLLQVSITAFGTTIDQSSSRDT
jgi:hypothetical protein